MNYIDDEIIDDDDDDDHDDNDDDYDDYDTVDSHFNYSVPDTYVEI